MVNRRRFVGGAIAAATLSNVLTGRSLPQKSGAAQESTLGGPIDSTVEGVLLRVPSANFTFSGMGLEEIVATMRAIGLSAIDMVSEHIEKLLGAPVLPPSVGREGLWVPRPKMLPGTLDNVRLPTDPAVREALRDWRLSVDLVRFQEVGELFRAGGLNLLSYNLSFDDSFTDPEIERGFLMTNALGAKIITASSPVDTFPRLKPFAEKHDVIVALHNHTLGPGDLIRAMAISEKFWVDLGSGQFFANVYDPLSFINASYEVERVIFPGLN